MPYASTDTAKLYFTVSGAGERTLLLIMGLGGHALEWGEPFLTPLRERYRVVCMDNRGIGRSESLVESWALEDMARDALAVLDACGCQKVLLGGTSMGGMVSQHVALLAPERVERLALMSTHFGGSEVVPLTAQAASLFTPEAGLSQGGLQRRTLRTLTTPGFADTHPELIEEYAALRERERTRARTFRTQMQAILSADRSQAVRSLRLPTLVVHGLDDELVPVDNGRMLAERIAGAQLVLLPNCGHFPHIEKPAECGAALCEFFA
jgi:pimeloyl-ACP methyl ester carboxylesterase